MGIYVNGIKYTSLEQIQELFENNPLLGWDDQWNEITEQLLNPKERIFKNAKFLEIELIHQQGLKDNFSDKYISDIYLKYIRREIGFYLEEVKNNLSQINIQKTNIVKDVTQKYMLKAIEAKKFYDDVDNIFSCFDKINIIVKEGKPSYIAETRTKQKNVTPADIDIYRGYLPSNGYCDEEYSFRRNVGRRIFTIVHELTHSVLGKYDKTKSSPVNIFAPQTFILGKSNGDYNLVLENNADSWALSFFKIRNMLAEIKT